MELSSLLPKSPLLYSSQQPRFLPKPICSLGVAFPKPPFHHSSSLSLSTSLPASPLLSGNFAAVSVSSVTALSAVGGGGDALAGGGGGGGGGGDGGSGGGSGGEAQAKSVSLEEALSQSENLIVLYVGGMTCGGCAASVKRILESQPQVSTATVYLEKETAVVWPVDEVKTAGDWQKQVGEKLANHLSTCGFKSHLQGEEKKSA